MSLSTLRSAYWEKGFPELVNLVDNSYIGRSPILGPLVKQIPALRSFRTIAHFDNNVGLMGLGKASTMLLDTLQFSLDTKGTIPDQLKLAGTPLVVISTHQGLIEPIYISSLLGREDSYIIAGMENRRYGTHVAQHLLPVRPSKFAGEKSSILYGPQMTKEEIMRMNEYSLHTASERIAQGNVLTIFPWGGRGEETGNWYTGLGRIIRDIPAEQRKATRILPIYFSGHNRESLKSLVQELLLHGQPTHKRIVQAQIGTSPLLDEIIQSYDDPHTITDNIRTFFLAQFNS